MDFLTEYAKTRKYSKFLWRVEWVRFSETIKDPDTKGLFFKSIMNYGLMCELPAELADEPLQYFNSVIMPELDRQHRQLQEVK